MRDVTDMSSQILLSKGKVHVHDMYMILKVGCPFEFSECSVLVMYSLQL